MYFLLLQMLSNKSEDKLRDVMSFSTAFLSYHSIDERLIMTGYMQWNPEARTRDLYLAVLGLNPAGGGFLHIENLIPCTLSFNNALRSARYN